ncbi:MAG: response regulator, partial [Desulfotignum sp.]|nr:response regulator [Desulfotignum sp.]
EISPTGTERILMVDDEPSLVKMVTQILERFGYEVIGKTSSTEVLEVFKENPERFDLVITDMAMPDMSGERMAQEIIQVRYDMPIIICTGHSDCMDENRAMELGIKAFIMKPIGMAELTKIVRKVLDDVKG